MRPSSLALAATTLLGVTLAFSGHARAFTVRTALSRGCHEEVTLAAIEDVPPSPEGVSLFDVWPLDREQDRLREGLGLTFAGTRDVGFVALSVLAGARWPDLMGANPLDLQRFNAVHNSDALLGAHCIRSADDDEPHGSRAAMQRCREYILAELAEARSYGQGGDLWQALEQTMEVDDYVQFVGTRPVQYSAVAFHLGRALHALQDAHTHAFRLDDGSIAVVINWTELVRGTLDERRDGPPHVSDIDECEHDHPVVQRAMQWARRDSARFLEHAMFGDEAAMRDFLDDVFVVRDGCSADNRWCDAPAFLALAADEYEVGFCRVSRQHERSAVLATLLLIVRRRRRRC